MTNVPFKTSRSAAYLGIALLSLMTAGVHAQVIKDAYAEFEHMELLSGDLGVGGIGGAAPVKNASGPYLFGFEGPSQYNAASFARNFIPPDTMGAVGKTQFVATTNGAYGIYDKATGNNLSMQSDVAFWAAAGQTGANGDTRIMYNAAASRWVAVSFGASVSDLQIAVSNTDNALGAWKSVKFTGFAGGTADYPTLALDKNAVYIGTNNFLTGCNPSTSFCGTTLNVIPLNSLFNGVAPTVANMKQIVTPYVEGSSSNLDRGFALQGVNSQSAGSTGKVVANSAFTNDNLIFSVNGLTASSATAATVSASSYLGVDPLSDPNPARQPSATNPQVIDALDQRISSSVYEAQGKLFTVQSVDDGSPTGHARVRYTVLDANTHAILDQGNLGTGDFDYFQGSIAVNAAGQVVIGYNRSGSQTADLNGDGLPDGNVSFMEQTFQTGANGHLISTNGGETLLKVSLTSDYHNGSVAGGVAAGRQRWGDYSQVSIDPNDPSKFWVIGEFAREFNNDAGGHPGGTGGSRWGTWIAEIDAGTPLPVPEPSSYVLMISGLAAIGFIAKRRRSLVPDSQTA